MARRIHNCNKEEEWWLTIWQMILEGPGVLERREEHDVGIVMRRKSLPVSCVRETQPSTGSCRRNRAIREKQLSITGSVRNVQTE